MLIPHKNGKWSWDNGQVFDTKDEAIADAESGEFTDSASETFIMDSVEEMEIIGVLDSESSTLSWSRSRYCPAKW